jgi:hypothetical protein
MTYSRGATAISAIGPTAHTQVSERRDPYSEGVELPSPH